jgi:nickel-dependent lactate racemase
MQDTVELVVGAEPWELTLPAAKRIELERAPVAQPGGSAAELVRAALEKPHNFEALRRALTPDDRVCVVVDPRLPYFVPMLCEVLTHIGSAGVNLSAVTVLSPPGASDAWMDELPDEFTDVTAETHDPTNEKKLAYLATTKGGRRVYLNRSLVEADFMVALTGRRYDPARFYAGAEVALFPELSNEETRAANAGPFTREIPWSGREEAEEIAWLLGTPFFVQVIEGSGDSVQEVVAGLVESSAEGKRRQDARWKLTAPERADVVIASVSGARERITFLDIARAAANAARVAKPGGRVAVLTDAAPDLGDAMHWLRDLDEPKAPAQRLAKEKPADWAECRYWCAAAQKVGVFFASSYPDEVIEELFATPIHSRSEVQRLLDGAERVIVIPDAHKARAALALSVYGSQEKE